MLLTFSTAISAFHSQQMHVSPEVACPVKVLPPQSVNMITCVEPDGRQQWGLARDGCDQRISHAADGTGHAGVGHATVRAVWGTAALAARHLL